MEILDILRPADGILEDAGLQATFVFVQQEGGQVSLVITERSPAALWHTLVDHDKAVATHM